MREEKKSLPETVEGNSSLSPLSPECLTLAEFIQRLGRLERFITTGEGDAAFGCGTKINSCPNLECVTKSITSKPPPDDTTPTPDPPPAPPPSPG